MTDVFEQARDELYASQYRRLNTLYHIVNKQGKLQRFTMNRPQLELYKGMHDKNIVLKARQLGFSTMIGLYMLDQSLFVPNTSAGIIAHTKDDATKLFNRVKIAYERMDIGFKSQVKLVKDNATELWFSNGSSMVVDTSMRSSTLQLLHISEFGYICAHFPEEAAEIMSGSLETVGVGGVTFIESTAEGSAGSFFDLWGTAYDAQKANSLLTSMDYKPFFFPWWREPSYMLGAYLIPNKEQAEYFAKLESIGIHLSGSQTAWYMKKWDILRDKMCQEYPSTPEEAFQGSADGMVYGRGMVDLRIGGRLSYVPYDPNALVHTAWDLGGSSKSSDATAIIFFQLCGQEIRIIDYLQRNGYSLAENIREVKSRSYTFGEHIAPHDIGVMEMSTGVSRLAVARQLGINFTVVGRDSANKQIGLIDGIDAVRGAFPRLWIDEDRTKPLLECLDNYCYEWDDRLVRWSDKPRHNFASHGADALRYLVLGIDKIVGSNTVGDEAKALRAYWG